jgi:AAA domain-containing protein
MSLPGINELLLGATGTGKTHAIGTLVEADPKLHVHFFAYEAGSESLIGYFTDNGKSVPPNLHISTVKPASASWTDLADNVRQINTLPYNLLKQAKDPKRASYDQFEKFLRAFNDVTDDSGQKWGSVDKWGTDHALVIDGLTGIGTAAMQTVVGGKMDKDQPDYGLAMSMIEELLRRLCNECRCHFVLISHIERESYEIGGSKITVATLGKKLAPKIPPMFSDVILCVRKGKEFFWDTEEPGADLKARNLSIASNHKPDFRALLAKWKSRGGVIGP